MIRMYREILARRGGDGELWPVVLAGGDGNRLAPVCRDLYGEPRPKQFCDFGTGRTLLQHTLARARRVAPDERIVLTTQRRHRTRIAAHVDGSAIRVDEQPANRDTLPGLLLPVLRLLPTDPDAVAIVLPSDHWVDDAAALMDAVLAAAEVARRPDEPVVALGARLAQPTEGYGWLLPGPSRGDGAHRVLGFSEKPRSDTLIQLMADGAVANTFVLVARARKLVELAMQHRPEWVLALAEGAFDAEALEQVYRILPASSYATDVLQRSAAHLAVTVVEGTGWSDVGTPDRLRRAFGAGIDRPRTPELVLGGSR